MMSRPTLQELKEIWRYAYARSAHNDTLAYIDALEKTPATDLLGLTIRQGLITAAIASYARPFTKSFYGAKESVVALSAAPLPTESTLLEEHERLINLRHKMIGHKDAQAWDKNVLTPNRVVIDRRATHFDLHTITLYGLDADTAIRLRKLCGHFLAYSEGMMGKLLKGHIPTIVALPEGRYELRLTESPEDWIVSVPVAVAP